MSAQWSSEWPATTRARSSWPTCANSAAPASARARIARERVRVAGGRGERQRDIAEQRGEGWIRGHDRPRAGRRLVHRLVERGARARLVRADDDIGSAMQCGDRCTGDGRQDRHTAAQRVVALDASLELLAVRSLVVGERRPADLELTSAPRSTARANASRSVPRPFQRAVRPRASSRSGPSCARRRKREPFDVDRVADPAHLRRSRAESSSGRR